ncbi:MAG: HD domain-containing protein [Candidatus Woesearchaeota archaeon]
MMQFRSAEGLNLPKIDRAYKLAESLHKGQKRDSGEPFIEHPVAVAELCSKILPDTELVCAALLHDVIEDCDFPISEIESEFGMVVARFVGAMSKNPTLPHALQDTEGHARIVRLAREDRRILILKLMDLLHNLETLDGLEEWRRKRYALHASVLYYPLLSYVELHGYEKRFEKALNKYLAH